MQARKRGRRLRATVYVEDREDAAILDGVDPVEESPFDGQLVAGGEFIPSVDHGDVMRLIGGRGDAAIVEFGGELDEHFVCLDEADECRDEVNECRACNCSEDTHGELRAEAVRRLEEHRLTVTISGQTLRLGEYLGRFGVTNDAIVAGHDESAPPYMVYVGNSCGGEYFVEEFTPQQIELRFAIAERMAGSRQVLSGLKRFDDAHAALVESGHLKPAPTPGHIERVRHWVKNEATDEQLALRRAQ